MSNRPLEHRQPTVGFAWFDAAGAVAGAKGAARQPEVATLLSDADWMTELRRRRMVALRPGPSISLVAMHLPLSDGGLVVLSRPATEAVFEFVAAVDFAWDILHHLLTDPFAAMTVVDAEALVAFISPVHERFFGLGRGEAIGRPVRDVIENTRLHAVIRSGQPEIGQLQRMNGAERVVSRVPIHRDGKLLGAIGRVMFKGPEQLDALHRRINALEKQVAFYKEEAKLLRGGEKRPDEMIGRSAAMTRLRSEIATVAPLDVSVLVTGESGTGKEVVARALHRLSPRASGPLVTVNSAALPTNLVESELFGYEAGAFTGADRKGRRGRFEQAAGGTLFLDEIGDMPLETQAKLLRVLQEHVVERVGGDQPVSVNFRLVCATNRDLAEMVAQGQFRLDLFYRISSIVLRLPSLADRDDDVLLLAEHMLAEFARHHGRPALKLDEGARARMRAAPWPGNVRQLRQIVERAAIFACGHQICAADIEGALGIGALTATAAAPKALSARTLDDVTIQDALRRTGGNKRQAAVLLGISRSHLYNRLGGDSRA